MCRMAALREEAGRSGAWFSPPSRRRTVARLPLLKFGTNRGPSGHEDHGGSHRLGVSREIRFIFSRNDIKIIQFYTHI